MTNRTTKKLQEINANMQDLQKLASQEPNQVCSVLHLSGIRVNEKNGYYSAFCIGTPEEFITTLLTIFNKEPHLLSSIKKAIILLETDQAERNKK